MPLIRIHDPADPRLEPYIRLKDRKLAYEGNRFMCESRRLVERMIEAGLQVESILCDERHEAEMQAIAAHDTPLYVISRAQMAQIAGYQIHTGVLGVGYRPRPPALDELFSPLRDPLTILVAPRVADQTNLGSLMRIAAGFGVSALVLGPASCDPFYRRSVRVSMGAVFQLPIYRSDDLGADLELMKEKWAVHRIATVLDADAQPLSAARRPAPPAPDRIALLIGHEVEGLSREEISWCDQKLSIPMHLGTDSLNIAVAAAVFCYHFCSACPQKNM